MVNMNLTWYSYDPKENLNLIPSIHFPDKSYSLVSKVAFSWTKKKVRLAPVLWVKAQFNAAACRVFDQTIPFLPSKELWIIWVLDWKSIKMFLID